VVVPEDYLSLHSPPSFAGDERLHIVPGFDVALRDRVLRLARRVTDTHEAWHNDDVPGRMAVQDGGVYAETRGPRFETRAEVRLLADYADVVGMTGASESTLLQERGIASAILAIVDNYAHGIGAKPLTLDAFDAQLEKNASRVRALLAALTKEDPWTS
jgi:5'-methylthioadenosine phosphorylase